MSGVMPQQMVGPAAWIPRGVDVLAAKEVGLHVHLLNAELALLDALVDPLVAGIEAAHMAAHGDDAGLLGDPHQLLGVLHAVGYRNFEQHMFSRTHHLLALTEVHLGGRGQDHRIGAPDAFAELAGIVRNGVFLGDFRGGVLVAADQRGDFYIRNALQGVQVLLTERALAGNANFHHYPLRTVVFARAEARLALAGAAPLVLGRPARFALRAAGRRLLPAARGLFSRMMCPTAVFEAGTV